MKPERDRHLLLDQLGFTLPGQPPPEIHNPSPVVETWRKSQRYLNDPGPKTDLTAEVGLWG